MQTGSYSSAGFSDLFICTYGKHLSNNKMGSVITWNENKIVWYTLSDFNESEMQQNTNGETYNFCVIG